jgi:hypothetical protein
MFDHDRCTSRLALSLINVCHMPWQKLREQQQLLLQQLRKGPQHKLALMPQELVHCRGSRVLLWQRLQRLRLPLLLMRHLPFKMPSKALYGLAV